MDPTLNCHGQNTRLPRLKNGNIDRIKVAGLYGWTKKEIYNACYAFKAMKRRCPDTEMSLQDYFDYIKESGLRPSMIGKRKGQYHLSRYNDSGVYSKTNARFIRQEINIAERKEGYQSSPEFKEKMSKIALQRQKVECPRCGGLFSPSMLARWHGGNCKS